MKKIGFTLAEVLIALGIIGVIAAITLPTFTSGVNRQAMASGLSSTVSALENAFAAMLMQNDRDTLKDTLFRYEDGGTVKKAYFYKNSSESKPYTAMKDYIKIKENADETNFTLKTGANLQFTGIYQSESQLKMADNPNEAMKLYNLTIDVNGTGSKKANQPNKDGVDKFYFIIGDDGRLYPRDDATKTLIQNGYKVK